MTMNAWQKDFLDDYECLAKKNFWQRNTVALLWGDLMKIR